MKVGDFVYAGISTGIVLNIEYVKAGQYWVTCLWNDGTIGGCGKSDIRLADGILTDKQLESVIGGMSPERFSQWRAEKLNETS